MTVRPFRALCKVCGEKATRPAPGDGWGHVCAAHARNLGAPIPAAAPADREALVAWVTAAPVEVPARAVDEDGGARIESSPTRLTDAPLAYVQTEVKEAPWLSNLMDTIAPSPENSPTLPCSGETAVEAADPEPFTSPVDLSLSETATMPLPPPGACRWPDCDQRSKAFGFCSTHRGRCVQLGYSSDSPPTPAQVPLLPGQWEARRIGVSAKLAENARATSLKSAATRRAKVAAVAKPIPAPFVEAPQPAVQSTAVARLVGVSPDASEAAILAAVRKMAAEVDTSRTETQLLDGTLADAGFPLTKAGCAKPGCGSRHLNDRLHQLANDRDAARAELAEVGQTPVRAEAIDALASASRALEAAESLRSQLCALFGGDRNDDFDDCEIVANVRDIIQRAGARATPAPADLALVRRVVGIQTSALRNLAVEDVGAFGIAVNLAADTIDAVCGVSRG